MSPQDTSHYSNSGYIILPGIFSDTILFWQDNYSMSDKPRDIQSQYKQKASEEVVKRIDRITSYSRNQVNNKNGKE